MNPTDFDSLLLRTLDDQRLSGGERRALSAVLADLAPDTQQLAFLRHRAFELARQQMKHPDDRNIVDWLEGVIKLLLPQTTETASIDSDACFSPEHDCPARIAGLFSRARRTVDVCVFTITDDRIASSMLQAHRRGVALRVITDNDKAFDLGSDVDRLAAAGVPVRVDRCEHHMHHKFAIFDGEVLLNGSYNWTRGAAQYNRENFLLTDNPRLVTAFTAMFDRLWNEFGR